jgi:hypothetical protein
MKSDVLAAGFAVKPRHAAALALVLVLGFWACSMSLTTSNAVPANRVEPSGNVIGAYVGPTPPPSGTVIGAEVIVAPPRTPTATPTP